MWLVLAPKRPPESTRFFRAEQTHVEEAIFIAVFVRTDRPTTGRNGEPEMRVVAGFNANLLDWLCEDHNAFRWLAGGVSLNYHTLSDFRATEGDFLDGVLTHSVAVLRDQDPVDLNRVAQDGMRVRASAGAASFHRRSTSEEHLRQA